MSGDQQPRQTVYIVTEGDSDAESCDMVLAVYESLADAFAFVEEYDSQGKSNPIQFKWDIEAGHGKFHAYCQRTKDSHYIITGTHVTLARGAVSDEDQATQEPLAAV